MGWGPRGEEPGGRGATQGGAWPPRDTCRSPIGPDRPGSGRGWVCRPACLCLRGARAVKPAVPPTLLRPRPPARPRGPAQRPRRRDTFPTTLTVRVCAQEPGAGPLPRTAVPPGGPCQAQRQGTDRLPTAATSETQAPGLQAGVSAGVPEPRAAADTAAALGKPGPGRTAGGVCYLGSSTSLADS